MSSCGGSGRRCSVTSRPTILCPTRASTTAAACDSGVPVLDVGAGPGDRGADGDGDGAYPQGVDRGGSGGGGQGDPDGGGEGHVGRVRRRPRRSWGVGCETAVGEPSQS